MSQIKAWVDAHHNLWDLDAVHYPWVAAKGEKRFFGQPYPIRKKCCKKFAGLQQQISQSIEKVIGSLSGRQPHNSTTS